MDAVGRLKAGNARYVAEGSLSGDFSLEMRERTAREGQRPFAVVICCSDSRVPPEAIFSCGIGELFVVRTAGNVVGEHELGSVEYAVGHLGCGCVVVMGHTHCGAVGAALAGGAEGHTATITDAIRCAVGTEQDERTACEFNVRAGIRTLSDALGAKAEVHGAIYDIESGVVDWL